MLYRYNVNNGIKCPESVPDTNELKCKLLSLVTQVIIIKKLSDFTEGWAYLRSACP